MLGLAPPMTTHAPIVPITPPPHFTLGLGDPYVNSNPYLVPPYFPSTLPVPDIVGPSQPAPSMVAGHARAHITTPLPPAAVSSLQTIEQNFQALTETIQRTATHTDYQMRVTWARIMDASAMLSSFADDLLRMDAQRGITGAEHEDRMRYFYDQIAAINLAISLNAPQYSYQPPPPPQ